jgi:hypothetical protein
MAKSGAQICASQIHHTNQLHRNIDMRIHRYSRTERQIQLQWIKNGVKEEEDEPHLASWLSPLPPLLSFRLNLGYLALRGGRGVGVGMQPARVARKSWTTSDEEGDMWQAARRSICCSKSDWEGSIWLKGRWVMRSWWTGLASVQAGPLCCKKIWAGRWTELVEPNHFQTYLCIQDDSELRPWMADVVLMLNSHSMTLHVATEPVFTATGERPSVLARGSSINEPFVSNMEPC